MVWKNGIGKNNPTRHGRANSSPRTQLPDQLIIVEAVTKSDAWQRPKYHRPRLLRAEEAFWPFDSGRELVLLGGPTRDDLLFFEQCQPIIRARGTSEHAAEKPKG
mmetsp:Transcript_29209/g.56560  ORF Transcript_29209/g.56560 Transcript_29209/m.56560 type:complete len:105 (-) Transcript_29209:1240-1554(-)